MSGLLLGMVIIIIARMEFWQRVPGKYLGLFPGSKAAKREAD